MWCSTILPFVLLATTPCLAALYSQIESLPNIAYDFVVIGGGVGGNVIANRLTENPAWNVLVIESGPSNEGVLDSEIPFFYSHLEHTAYDWNFTTTPQQGLNGRVVDYPRGHILGGTSSINQMFYSRGSSSDFNRFAKVTGDSGWSWDKLQPYFRKNEKWVPPVDHHNTSGQFIPSLHSFDGINSVSLSGFPQATDARVIQTTIDLKDEFPFNQDQNSGNPLGVGWLQWTIGGGERSSSAISYLAPKFINRHNLHVLVNTRVTRILQTKAAGNQPVFRTVEFSQSANGPRTSVTASKEIILSAGAISTPQILLNSGIGDASELKMIGIKPIVHLPDVGKNLSDHLLISNSWFVNSNDTYDNIANNATFAAEVLEQWKRNHTGPLAVSGASHLVWSRLPNDSPIFNVFTDPSSGSNTPHYELVIQNGGGAGVPAQGHFITILFLLVTPVSRGNVTLRTSNPFDNPLINPGYLDSGFDIFTFREAMRSGQRFLTAPAWNDYIIGPLQNLTTDDQLDQYIRQSTNTGAHPVGTAAMSAKGAKYGVVDPDLLVKEISGLRIVDASVMPFIPSGHTQVPVYVIAERAADLIKSVW